MQKLTNNELEQLVNLYNSCVNVAQFKMELDNGKLSWDEILTDDHPVWNEVPKDISPDARRAMAMGFLRGVGARATHDAAMLRETILSIHNHADKHSKNKLIIGRQQNGTH